jgi:hypothetical protein
LKPYEATTDDGRSPSRTRSTAIKRMVSSLEQARCLLGEGQQIIAEDFLNKTYKGPDADGIGLRWTVY